MNVTQYKDGSKSVKTFSLSELVDTMKDRASGRAVEEFRVVLVRRQVNCPGLFLVPNTGRRTER